MFVTRLISIILLICVAVVALACTDSQLNGFKATVDTANTIVQSDKPAIASLVTTGAIPKQKGDEFIKIADGLNAFNNAAATVQHFPPANATELVTQANSLITEIAPLVADPTTHPVLAFSLGTLRAGLTLTIKKLGGKPVEIGPPLPPDNRSLNQLLADLKRASRELQMEAG